MLSAETLAFYACCAINFTDLCGVSFVGPVLVPYGLSLGAEQNEIAMFQTIRFAGAFVSNFWMPFVADKAGYKVLLLFSTVGTGCSYLMQGLAQELATDGSKNGVYLFLAGRLIGGLFGGTQPVLRAFTTQISMPDTQLLKTRLTILLASNQAAGMFLAPIAGSVSRWGLHLPWLISAVCAGACLLFVSVFFVNPAKLQEKKQKMLDEAAGGHAPAVHQMPAYQGGSPYADPRLLLASCGMTSIIMGISALILLMPFLLQFEEFGLVVKDLNGKVDQTETLKNVANAAGVLSVPNGILQLLMGTVFFLLISKRIGDMPTMRIGSVLVVGALACYGVAAKTFWNLLVIHGVSGIGLGLVMPALGPKMAQYCKLAHSKNIAKATAMQSIGMSLGFMIGPPIMMNIAGDGKDRDRINLAFLVASGIAAVGVLLNNTAVFLMGRHSAVTATQRKPAEIEAAWRSNAMDEGQFIDEMGTLLKAMLTKGSPQYRNWDGFHGNIQRSLRRALSDLFPILRPFKQDDHGAEHFGDVWTWLVKYGTAEEKQWFLEFAERMDFRKTLGDDESVNYIPQMSHESAGLTIPDHELVQRQISLSGASQSTKAPEQEI